MTLYSDKVKGSLLAAAIGDGLGSFTECLHYKTVDKIYPSLPPNNFRGPIDYTDDTSLRLILYDAILTSDMNAFNLAEHWKNKVVDNKVYWTSELFVTAMLSMGRDPHLIGFSNLLADNAAMAADPIGALYPCLDELAALRAYETLSICQSGKGLEGAMAVAAAVSKSLSPVSRMDDIVGAAERWVGKEMKDRIEEAISIVSSSQDPRKKLYEELLVEDGTSDLVWNDLNSASPSESVRRLIDMRVKKEDVSMSVSPSEVVPIAIGYAVKGEKEPLEGIRLAAHFGRDCDTIAGITGSILGAYQGAKSLPKDSFDLLPPVLVTKSDEISLRMVKIASHLIECVSGHTEGAKTLFSS